MIKVTDGLNGTNQILSRDQTLTLAVNGSNLLDCDLFMYFKRSLSDDNAEALVKSSEPGGGISISNNTGSSFVATIEINSEDFIGIGYAYTNRLADCFYSYLIRDSAGELLEYDHMQGTFKLKLSAGREGPS